MPVLCAEFESMTHVGLTIERASEAPPLLASFEGPDWDGLRSDLESLETDWSALEARLMQEIHSLAREPRFNCMYRHLVESMVRTVRAAPNLASEASDRGLNSPEKWSVRLLKSHFDSMDEAMDLDRMAAPIQADGVPIICNDVPPL